MSDEIQIYDIGTDSMRPATQADVDRLEAIAQAYGKLRYLLRRLFALHPEPGKSYDLAYWREHSQHIGSLCTKLDQQLPSTRIADTR